MKSFCCGLVFLFAINAMAQSSQIEFSFRTKQDLQADTYDMINRVVQNPALASGLASGTDSINRTVDSLMESIFYSVMDQELRYQATDSVDWVGNYHRDVHPTAIGSFVIVDRFQLGPEFLKDLGKLRGLGLSLKSQGKVFIENIAYRSDAQRKAEEKQRGFWADLLANWFGILPVMAQILPPSFNEHELYDPIGYLQTPFVFPTTLDDLLSLPLATVRSYGLSTGNTLSLDTAGRSVQSLQKSLNLADLDLAIPLSVFRDGQHRIAVLRRDNAQVLVALSEWRRIGVGVQTLLGKDYRILQKVMKWWSGVAAPISLVDWQWEKSRIFQIDELYSFDLQVPKAQEACLKAIHGNFSLARSLSEAFRNDVAQIKETNKNGVSFQFYRITQKQEKGIEQERSLYVAQTKRHNRVSAGESKTTDPEGEFLTLESELYHSDKNWNVLVGADHLEFRNRLSIPVIKEKAPAKAERYILATNANQPIYLTTTLRLIDNFADVRDYNRWMGLLKRYSGLSMDDAPAIPVFAEDVQKRALREQALANPMEEIALAGVSPTFLGKMEASAHLYFAHDLMMALSRRDEDTIWSALAFAYEYDPRRWGREEERSPYLVYGNLIASYLLTPVKLIHFEGIFPEISREALRLKDAFRRLNAAKEPQDLLNAYQKLLDSENPLILVQTLGKMAQGLPLPIYAGFKTRTSAKKQDTPDIRTAKRLFSALDGKIFESPWPIPPLKRDQSIEEKIAQFLPGGYREERTAPSLDRATLNLDATVSPSDPPLSLLLQVRSSGPSRKNLQLYIRFEQHGALNLGRFVLSEDILDIKPELINQSRTGRNREEYYRIPLNRQEGLPDFEFLKKAIQQGDSFDLHLSLSEDGKVWSSERSFSFGIAKGLLQKL